MITLLLGILNTLFIGWLIWQFSRRFQMAAIYPYFWPALVWKLINGMFYGIFYLKFYQGGDSWLYFSDALTLAQWAPTDVFGYAKSFITGLSPDIADTLQLSGQRRAVFMAHLISPLALVTQGNYWIMAGYLSLASFMGLWWLVYKLSITYPGTSKAAVWAFLFLPSTVFWSSGISKEALFMAGWGYLIAFGWPYFKGREWPGKGQVLFLLLLCWLLIVLKYYYMAVILPVLMAAVATRLMWPRKNQPGYYWLALFVLLTPAFTILHTNLYVDHIFHSIKENAYQIIRISDPQMIIHYTEHHNPIVWSLINMPKALISGLIRPFWFDIGGIWQNLSIIESTLIVIIGLGSLKSLSLIRWSSNWALPLIIYILLMATLLALSTPNLGTLVRYKVAFFPWLVYLLFSQNPWWQKLTAQLP